MKNLIALPAVLLLAACLGVEGCAFIRSSAISESVGKGNAVSTSTSDMGYLYLVAPQNLTQNANQQLASQCPSGKFTDVQTELSVRDFFAIVQIYQVNASAVCQ